MKLTLLLTPFPLVALFLLPHGPELAPPRGVGPIPVWEPAEERACSSADTRLGHEIVRVPWTSLGSIRHDIEAFYCVLHGDVDAPLAFARDAERVRFTLVGRGENPRHEAIGFRITTSAGRTLTIGPAAVVVAPRDRRSCRVEICTAFTEPGERVATVEVLTN